MVQERLAKERVSQIFENWLEENPRERLPFTPIETLVEIPFQVPLADDIVYCGRIDALAQMASGNWVVIDFKTTRSAFRKGDTKEEVLVNQRWLKKFKMDTQITGYLYAASRHVGEPVLGMMLGVQEIPDKKVGKAKCKEHGVPHYECDLFHAKFKWVGPIQRTEAQISHWKQSMTYYAEQYRFLYHQWIAEERQGTDPLEALSYIQRDGTFKSIEYANACVSCEFADFCEADCPVQFHEQYLRYEPWFCMEI